jgi:error-prone DNA polymerase
MIRYAELQALSNFTFLEGASHPDELALTAAALGHAAFAVTDRNSLAGVVQAHQAARKHGMRYVVGCRLDLTDAGSLLAYPTDRAAYARLSRLLTLGKRRAPKGECFLARADVVEHAQGMLFIALPPADTIDPAFLHDLRRWRDALPRHALHLAASHRYRGDDARRLAWLADTAAKTRVPLVATNDVRMHAPGRRALADVLTCIRLGTTIDEAGWRLAANAERHLKAPDEMTRLFRDYPGAVARTVELADACAFSLDELRYEYPDEVADGIDPQDRLAELTWAGAAEMYPDGVPAKVRATLEHELALIGQLRYAPYFLTVHDIVRFARSRDILCQGRGSAANSAVCFCLGVTSVDPAEVDLLFERFISAERGEPPDIDVDFEHERREEVIQYIYAKYGRDRAGLTATVIRYRARAAIREVSKAMGLSADIAGRLSGSIWGWSREAIDEERARQYGLDPGDPRLALTLELTRELIGFPRHLSQHVGGFVMTRGLLSEMTPILNAAMDGRTNIEWDKDDIDALGILKVDVLALGMLTCVRKAFDLIAEHEGERWTLATIPRGVKAVYDMLGEADTIGVFQVESRAQMTMLPRLRPKTFYDLVIEVAIMRPGPIQGNMVHPYLRRRSGKEPVEYPSKELEAVLGKTLGVPLFQEQAMRIAIVAAGFTPAEADQLRRAMATFRKTGQIHAFETKMVEGMVTRGYDRDFAERCFRQIEGFGEYGFPESHAASFARLVYVSAWIKRFHHAAFAAALLNSQPMGFYAPAQIVRDAAEHGVPVRPADIARSNWDCTLERAADGRLALRLGLRMIRGLAKEDAEAIVTARGTGYRDVYDVWRRAGVEVSVLERLAKADAFASLGLDRRQALWAVRALGDRPLPLFAHLADSGIDEPAVALPEMAIGEQVVMDYASLSLSLKAHPLALLREDLRGVTPAGRLPNLRDGVLLTVAGLVLVRQRPGTAKGVVFLTLEDETGVANLVLMPDVFQAHRKITMTGRLIAATGRLEKREGVIHVRPDRLADLTPLLSDLAADPGFAPEDMDGALAHGDEVRRPVPERLPGYAGVFPKGRNFH